MLLELVSDGPKCIAVRKLRNRDAAQEYCSERYENGALCSFHNDTDFDAITELIKTESIEHPYWTGLKKMNGNYEFSDRTSTAYAQTNISQLCKTGCNNENGSYFIEFERKNQEPHFKLGTSLDIRTSRFICQVKRGNIFTLYIILYLKC